MAFRQHEKSQCHKIAVEKLITLPATTRDVGEMLAKNLSSARAMIVSFLLIHD